MGGTRQWHMAVPPPNAVLCLLPHASNREYREERGEKQPNPAANRAARLQQGTHPSTTIFHCGSDFGSSNAVAQQSSSWR